MSWHFACLRNDLQHWSRASTGTFCATFVDFRNDQPCLFRNQCMNVSEHMKKLLSFDTFSKICGICIFIVDIMITLISSRDSTTPIFCISFSFSMIAAMVSGYGFWHMCEYIPDFSHATLTKMPSLLLAASGLCPASTRRKTCSVHGWPIMRGICIHFCNVCRYNLAKMCPSQCWSSFMIAAWL